MPSFSSSSSIRVASQDHVLRLKITHNLDHGYPSNTVHSFKGRLPKELDVLWLSDISISISGSLDGHQIPAHEIARSGLAHHFQMQLKTNSDQLGLNNVSRPFVDDADGLSKLTLTPSRPLPDVTRPHANLVSLHLVYIWRTVAGCIGDIADPGHMVEEINPFSPTLFLPVEALLTRVTEQFLIYHIVSRYPLIFGSWCQRFDLEMQHFPSIGRSIVEIMIRSSNPRFLSKCKRLLKMARRQHKYVFQTAAAALSSCTDEEDTDGHVATPILTDEQVVCESLEQLFRIGVPQRRFKPAARVAPQFVSSAQDDDGLLECMSDVGIDNDASWVELPEIATPPLDFREETLSEETDVFTQEDWSESRMWLPHEADNCREREFDAQSDESLIGGSMSLASITTRSAQVGPVTLDRQQDVNLHELDPAAGGLRYKFSQLTYVEDAETLAVFASLTHSPSYEPHDHYYSENSAQVTETWDAGVFESLDGWSDRDEVDSMIFELNDLDSAVDVTLDEPLV